MAFRAVTDADVLYPASLRDTLLRMAELELYDVFWSQRILEEVTRNLIEDARMTDAQAAHLIEHMNLAFESALVPEEPIARLEAAMTNDPKDRHVLATAVAVRAEVVITRNVKHFPED